MRAYRVKDKGRGKIACSPSQMSPLTAVAINWAAPCYPTLTPPELHALITPIRIHLGR